MFLPNFRDKLSVGQLDREDLVEGFQSVIAHMVRERSSLLRMSKEGEDVALRYVHVKIGSFGATIVSGAISYLYKPCCQGLCCWEEIGRTGVSLITMNTNHIVDHPIGFGLKGAPKDQ